MIINNSWPLNLFKFDIKAWCKCMACFCLQLFKCAATRLVKNIGTKWKNGCTVCDNAGVFCRSFKCLKEKHREVWRTCRFQWRTVLFMCYWFCSDDPCVRLKCSTLEMDRKAAEVRRIIWRPFQSLETSAETAEVQPPESKTTCHIKEGEKPRRQTFQRHRERTIIMYLCGQTCGGNWCCLGWMRATPVKCKSGSEDTPPQIRINSLVHPKVFKNSAGGGGVSIRLHWEALSHKDTLRF